jgi:hypothetical protein
LLFSADFVAIDPLTRGKAIEPLLQEPLVRDANGQRAASTELADRDRNRASKGADVREFFWWIDQHRNIAA